MRGKRNQISGEERIYEHQETRPKKKKSFEKNRDKISIAIHQPSSLQLTRRAAIAEEFGERRWKSRVWVSIREPFSRENILLHSKSKWDISAVKLFRFKVVTIQKRLKLFGIREIFELWQYIELTVQNFLLNRILSADKEMSNSFFLTTITAISVTVADFKTISI